MQIEDRLAIQELLARYNFAFDSGDADGWSDCFTTEGVFHGMHGLFEGRDALRAYAERATTRQTYRHLTGNVLIEARPDDPNSATVKSYVLYYEVETHGPVPRISAVLHDEVVKVDGKWRILCRRVSPDTPKPL